MGVRPRSSSRVPPSVPGGSHVPSTATAEPRLREASRRASSCAASSPGSWVGHAVRAGAAADHVEPLRAGRKRVSRPSAGIYPAGFGGGRDREQTRVGPRAAGVAARPPRACLRSQLASVLDVEDGPLVVSSCFPPRGTRQPPCRVAVLRNECDREHPEQHVAGGAACDPVEILPLVGLRERVERTRRSTLLVRREQAPRVFMSSARIGPPCEAAAAFVRQRLTRCRWNRRPEQAEREQADEDRGDNRGELPARGTLDQPDLPR